MPSLEYFVVSQSVSVDQRTNRVSIFEVLDELQPVRFPALMPRVIALSVWILEPEDQGKDFQATLKVSGPQLELSEFAQNFTADGPRLRTLHHLVGVPILGAGALKFEIFLNGERSASHHINVNPADSEEPTDGTLTYPKSAPNAEEAGNPEA